MANNSSSSSSSFDSSSTSSEGLTSSSSSQSSSSTSSSSFGYSESSYSTASSSSSSLDSSSSSSSSYLDYHDQRLIPFIYQKSQEKSIWTIAFDSAYAYAGTSENGMIIRSKDRYNWENYYQIEDTLVTSLFIYRNIMYVGTAPEGKIYRFNLTNGTVIEDGSFGGPIVGFSLFNEEIYVAVSKPAVIYKLNKNTWNSFYRPYGKSINQMSVVSNKLFLAMDAENVVSYDGTSWKIEISQPDNISTTRRVSKNVFSRVSWDFINTKGINVTDGLQNEDILDIFPYNRLVGINSFVQDGSTVTIGGKNYGRVFNYNNGNLVPIFDTDSIGVQCLLNLDTGVNLAAIGNKLYLVHCGDITTPTEPTPTEPTPDPNAGKTVIITSPNGGENLIIGSTVDITWTSTRGVNDAVKLSLYKNGSEALVISGTTSNDGIFEWNIPLSLNVGEDYQMYIEWLSAGVAADADKDLSDSTFSLLYTLPESVVVVPEVPTEGIPDITQCRGIPIIHFNNGERIIFMTKDLVKGGVLLSTSFGRILYADDSSLNAYRTGNRLIYADVTDGFGNTSETTTEAFLYALYKRIVEINEGKEIKKWKYMENATSIPVERIKAVFISPVLQVQEDIGFWKQLIWTEDKPTDTKITVCIRTGNSITELQSQSWGTCFNSEIGESNPITRELNNVNLNGQFAQFRILMETTSNDETPTITNATLVYSTKRAQYFYTVKFSLKDQSNISKGLITGTMTQPTNTEVTFGYNASNSSNWDNYKIIDPNKFFEIEDIDNIKLGIRMVSYDESLPVVDEFAIMFGGDKTNEVNR